ncbi:MAG: orotidine-5'-phosphate decarboxylase [Patescibacteria group bacterium]|nr:orotidine-5'-phosphate decarboxylase [Patescibacteria group bacterium]
MKPRDRIIVALDVDNLGRAKELIESLAPHVGCFKVGLELITAVGGPQIVQFVHGLGGKVFYDGKFCDIPNTVGKAAKAAANLGVKMFNVHANCGIDAMQEAVMNKGRSHVLAVTVLTSLDEDSCHLIYGAPSKAKVMQFAREATLAGMDGIICSPQELTMLAKRPEFGPGFLFVTPGVRPEWASANDQKRVMTPGEAIKAGAAYARHRPPDHQPAQGSGHARGRGQAHHRRDRGCGQDHGPIKGGRRWTETESWRFSRNAKPSSRTPTWSTPRASTATPT